MIRAHRLAIATLVLAQTQVLNAAETPSSGRKCLSQRLKRAYENSSEEDSVLASKGSATVIKRKKVPSQKFLPAYHEAYPCLVPSRKGSEIVLCTTCKSDFHGSLFDCVSNLLRANPIRSSKRLESFFPASSLPFSLFSPPFSLSLVLMQQTYSFSALVNSDSTSLQSYLPRAFLIIITKNARCDWLLCWGSANEKICCSHCCEVQKKCTRLLSRALAARVVCTQSGGGSTHCFWVTGRLICTTALSF